MKRIYQSWLTRYIKNRMPRDRAIDDEEYQKFLKILCDKYEVDYLENFEIINRNHKYGSTIYTTRMIDEVNRVKFITTTF